MHYPAFPASGDARDRFVLARRSPRPLHDAWRYQDVIVEDERTEDGSVARVGTVLLTGRECPWRCVMCDLWRGTTVDDTPRGAIPAQMAAARREFERLGEHPSRVKLYNAGSFFDPRAVPEDDYEDVARGLAGIDHVIVESHPSLVSARVDRLRAALAAHGRSALEVAIGLETAHPAALAALNKRMTVDDFGRAADFLRAREIAVRTFLLIWPPGVPDAEQDDWLSRSIDVAFESGAGVVSLVPTRGGNGALEALAAAGQFRQPRIADIERVFDRALGLPRDGLRVFVDLWDLERFAGCSHCLAARRTRLHAMNLEQRRRPAIACAKC